MDREFSRRPTTRQRGRVTLPGKNLTRLPSVPRNPPGYGTSEVSLRTRGLPGAQNLQRAVEPAGDPPDDWPGTRPEWAFKWALDTLGYEMNEDYYYEFNVAGIGASYYSQFDFVIPAYHIAVEVQGEFWHYSQGHTMLGRDELRRNMAAQFDFTLIFVDEDDVLVRPVFLAEEAIRGIDHSKTGKR